MKAALKTTITHNGTELRFYSDLSAGLLQKRCEFGAVSKALESHGLYFRLIVCFICGTSLFVFGIFLYAFILLI